MITRCHHCGAEFDVSSSLVFSRDPSVRCGQCMELFDAKANLYDKSEAAKAAATFKPVNPVKVDRIDVAALENAETIAVEHRYVRANKANSSAAQDANYQQPDFDLGAGPERIPVYDHDSAAAVQLEMDQTIAMRRKPQRPMDNLSGNNVEAGISEHRFEYDQSHAANLQAKSHAADMRMQKIRDRERRALDIEPARGLSAEQMRIVEEFRHRNNTGTSTSAGSVGDAMDDVAASVGEKTKDLEFIPDNALQQNTVYRESGWQESSPSSVDGVPEFATQKTEQQLGWQQQASPQGGPQEQPKGSQALDTSRAWDKVNEAPMHEGQQFNSPDANTDVPEQRTYPASPTSNATQVQETSAQEMRRYLSQRSADGSGRPANDRNAVVSHNRAVDHQPPSRRIQSGTSSKSGSETKSSPSSHSNNTWLWVLGLIVIGCVGLYVGRDSVANLELPDAILTPFCQVTGCTPG